MGGSTLLAKNYAANHNHHQNQYDPSYGNHGNRNITSASASSSTSSASSIVTRQPMERKLKKPLMEKRRRARINQCLIELKHILLQASPHQRTKLEKADILEMTVNYLRTKRTSDAQLARQRFVDGFNHCSNVVLQLVNSHVILGGGGGPATSGAGDHNSWKLAFADHLSNNLKDRLNSLNGGGGATIAQQPPNQPHLATSVGPSGLHLATRQVSSSLTLVIPQTAPPTTSAPHLVPIAAAVAGYPNLNGHMTTPMPPTPPFTHGKPFLNNNNNKSAMIYRDPSPLCRSGSTSSNNGNELSSSSSCCSSSFSPCGSNYSTVSDCEDTVAPVTQQNNYPGGSMMTHCLSKNDALLWRPW